MFTKNVKKKLIPFAVISSLAVAGYAGVSTDTEAKSDNSKKIRMKSRMSFS